MTNPNPATRSMLAALRRYDPSYHGGLPDLGTVFAYISADLMIKGLEMAGPSPTRSRFITKLRTLTGYDANGLLPQKLEYTHFGTPAGLPKTECEYFLQLRSDRFVSTNGGKPFCGPLVRLRA